MKIKLLTFYLAILMLFCIPCFAIWLIYLTKPEIEITGIAGQPICVSWGEKIREERKQGILYRREKNLRERINDETK